MGSNSVLIFIPESYYPFSGSTVPVDRDRKRFSPRRQPFQILRTCFLTLWQRISTDAQLLMVESSVTRCSNPHTPPPVFRITISNSIAERQGETRCASKTTSKFDLAIESNPDGSYTYYYDPARPESVLSRAEIDAALQSAAGRKDAVATSSQSSSEPGSRYIDFLIPGLLGMNLMNSGMWGVGFALVEMRQRKLLKRFVATPMRRSDFLLALISSRLVLMVIEVALVLGFGVLAFHMRVEGSILSVILLG